MEAPHALPLDVHSCAELIEDGCLVIDTRSSAAFGSGHIPGSYHMHLSDPQFEQRVGWVTPVEVPLVLLVENDSDADRAMHALAFVGLDQRVRGYVAGGMPAWIEAGMQLVILPQIGVHQLYDELRNGRDMLALDVREAHEWNEVHVEGTHNVSYKYLGERLNDLPFTPADRIAVLCATGKRSSTAGSVLLRSGFQRLYNVSGGMSAWLAADLPVVRG